MNKFYVLFFAVAISFVATAQNCADQWKAVFEKRGAYAVADDIHRNVIIAIWEGEEVFCVQGKARVENGTIIAIWVMLEDGEYNTIEKKLLNSKNQPPSISNGMSEIIYTSDKEKFQVFFKDKIKPKQKGYKQVGGPGDEFK
ncbi:MAG: hypothetical protein KDC84_10420 [Crocinitomicaceae bacterium]|nr:hypothetical protein [Crocinitomicaceae bacterium]